MFPHKRVKDRRSLPQKSRSTPSLDVITEALSEGRVWDANREALQVLKGPDISQKADLLALGFQKIEGPVFDAVVQGEFVYILNTDGLDRVLLGTGDRTKLCRKSHLTDGAMVSDGSFVYFSAGEQILAYDITNGRVGRLTVARTDDSNYAVGNNRLYMSADEGLVSVYIPDGYQEIIKPALTMRDDECKDNRTDFDCSAVVKIPDSILFATTVIECPQRSRSAYKIFRIDDRGENLKEICSPGVPVTGIIAHDNGLLLSIGKTHPLRPEIECAAQILSYNFSKGTFERKLAMLGGRGMRMSQSGDKLVLAGQQGVYVLRMPQ